MTGCDVSNRWTCFYECSQHSVEGTDMKGLHVPYIHVYMYTYYNTNLHAKCLASGPWRLSELVSGSFLLYPTFFALDNVQQNGGLYFSFYFKIIFFQSIDNCPATRLQLLIGGWAETLDCRVWRAFCMREHRYGIQESYVYIGVDSTGDIHTPDSRLRSKGRLVYNPLWWLVPIQTDTVLYRYCTVRLTRVLHSVELQRTKICSTAGGPRVQYSILWICTVR